MGRFHRHDDGTVHAHDTGNDHDHEQEHATGDHSGYVTGGERVEVLERVFEENDKNAAASPAEVAAAAVRVVHLVALPGAGKTPLLRETLARLAGQVRVGIIEGDIET